VSARRADPPATFALAKERPSWIGSTASSVAAETRAARAKIVCSVRTALPGKLALAAMMAWPSS
jgi:hypothetical protein